MNHGDSNEPGPPRIARIENAVRKLPRVQRDIFLAVRLDAYSYADIAKSTGLSIAQVERLFAKALRSYRRNSMIRSGMDGGAGSVDMLSLPDLMPGEVGAALSRR